MMQSDLSDLADASDLLRAPGQSHTSDHSSFINSASRRPERLLLSDPDSWSDDLPNTGLPQSFRFVGFVMELFQLASPRRGRRRCQPTFAKLNRASALARRKRVTPRVSAPA